MPRKLPSNYTTAKFRVNQEQLTRYANAKRATDLTKNKGSNREARDLVYSIEALSHIDDLTSLRIMLNHLKNNSQFYDPLVRIVRLPQYEKYRQLVIRRIVEELETDDIFRSQAVDALKKLMFDPNSVFLCCTLLKGSRNKNQQLNLMKVLGAAKDPIALRFLIPFLNSENVHIKSQAMFSITRLDPKRGSKIALAYLLDPKTKNIRLRKNCIENLRLFMTLSKSEIEKKEAMTMLIDIFNSEQLIKAQKPVYDFFYNSLLSDVFRPVIDSLSKDQKDKLDRVKIKIKKLKS